jgi:hypothetical protein
MIALTEKQAEQFEKAKDKLPAGYEYRLHDKDGHHEHVPVWGVTLYRVDGFQETSLGFVGRNMAAKCTTSRKDTALQKLLLNRAASALWHKQPRW